jgi:mono/diheme cytochrome c family protein
MKSILKYSYTSRYLLIIAFIGALVGCFESAEEELAEDGDKVSASRLGAVYYADNCAVCHSAGLDDTTIAFSASDLAQSTNLLNTDLSNYGGQYQLMDQFSDVSQLNIDNLESYLATF